MENVKGIVLTPIVANMRCLMNRYVYLSVVVLVILLSFGALVLQQIRTHETENQNDVAVVYQKPSTGEVTIGGKFSLIDQNGHSKTDLDFRGRYMIVYFGYSYCPDICPMALNSITEALNLVGEKAKALQPIFITVDPERDTSWHLHQYLKNFYSTFVGLTGSYADIQDVIKRYHVYANKINPEDASDYLIDHSSIIYFMDPQGRYLTHCNHNSPPEEIVKIINSIVS